MRHISLYLPAISKAEALKLFAAAPGAFAIGHRGDEARQKFEAAWTERFQSQSAAAFPSARSALTATLVAGAVRPGDDVLATGFTCTAVAEAIVAAGARPVWADIEPARFGMSPDALERAITPKSRAVIIQHTFGFVADVAGLKRELHRKDLLVIEDSCLALGSGRAGIMAGSSGDASVFSFELSKTISAGWGGIAQINRENLAAGLRQIQSQAGAQPRLEACSRLLQAAVYSAAYSPGPGRFVGYPAAAMSKLGMFKDSSSHTSPKAGDGRPVGAGRRYMGAQADAQWTALLSQFNRLNSILSAHRVAAAQYLSVLSAYGLGGWLAWMDPGEVLIRFPLVVKDRERMTSAFARRGIELGRWFDYPVSPVSIDASAYNYTPGQCPAAEQVSRHIVNLPVHARLTAHDLENVCTVLHQYLKDFPEERDFISAWTEQAKASAAAQPRA